MKPLYTAHPIYDRFHWLEPIVDAFVEHGVGVDDYLSSPVTRRLGRLASQATLDRNFRSSDRAYLGVMANGNAGRCFPRVYTNEIIIVGMDCWGPAWDRWAAFLKRARIRVAALTARQSAEEMARRVPGLRALWLPEGIDLEPYSLGPPLEERRIDALQVGRRYDPLHESIEGPLAREGKAYVYPTGGWMFPDHASMLEALRTSKVFFCYPRCDTHPERAGGVETLTLRYLEGFACGCIVAGRSPQELVDLFGYDPVVPVQPGPDAPARVLELIESPGSLQELVDRNLETVRRIGTWDVRTRLLLDQLEPLGYAPPPRVEALKKG